MREIPKKKNIPSKNNESNQQEIDDFCHRLASILVSIVLEEEKEQGAIKKQI